MTRCMELLEESPEWANILDAWAKDEKMGLAQKRYDRLEWVHGGQMSSEYMERFSMQKTHDLELRPKHHYPTTVKSEDGGGFTKEEPSPMEGFLVCLSEDYDSDPEGTCSDERRNGRREAKSPNFSLRPGYRILSPNFSVIYYPVWERSSKVHQ